MRTFLFYFILISHKCFTQQNCSIYTEIYQVGHTNVFTETNFSIGASIKKIKFSIIPTLHYQFGGNIKIANPYNVITAYHMQYHLLGIGTKIRFLEERKYSPSVGIVFLKEIASNYAGKYLKSYNENYSYKFRPSDYYAIEQGNQTPTDKYFVYYYVSTPFLANFCFSNEFRLMKGLYLNIGLGYSARALKVRSKTWFTGQEEPQANTLYRNSLSDLNWKHYLDLSIGLNYTVLLKKKE